MSINVTVSGNPVRINRGKMVTAQGPTKTEFEKRRLMRLEQVRQQSKNIAENVRNRFKKEKTKCLSEIEKDGEAQLKNWQAKKLLELQDQYQEALVEIGLGHKDAARVENEEEIFHEQQESNERMAKERGRVAAERLQIQRNEENLKKSGKKVMRDVEIAQIGAAGKRNKNGKSPFKKMKKGRQTFDSDGENRVPQLLGLDEESDVFSINSEDEVRRNKTQERERIKVSKEQQTSAVQVPTTDKAAQTIPYQEPVPTSQNTFNFDTRISERIKRRTKLNPETDYCDLVEPTKTPFCTCCHCPAAHQNHRKNDSEVGGFEHKEATQQSTTSVKYDKKESTQKFDFVTIGPETLVPERFEEENIVQQKSVEEENIVQQKSVEEEKSRREPVEDKKKDDKQLSKKSTSVRVPHRSGPTFPFEKTSDPKPKSTIPPKPKVTLRSTKDRPAYISTDGTTQPVQFYDHPNRYTKSYLPKSPYVEQIDDEEIEISPNLSEEEIRERMRKRDLEAHMRGELALEKERIQREYRELMKKLPALQKQERIFEIGKDKKKYHMARDRLEELEKRRQNRLDNAYEELFVRNRPAVVTLPKRKDDLDEESLNVGSWDVDFDPKDESVKSRCETLNGLLMNLKTQKDSLLKEIEGTMSHGGSMDVKSKSTDYSRVKTRRKRSRDERPVSPTSSDINGEETATMRTKSSKKGTLISTTTSSPSPRKKAKSSSRRVLVLQNTSTQTTPKIDFHSAATSPIANLPDADACTCKKSSLDDLCEIVIKIKDDEKPEVTVNPPFLGKSVRVVAEGAALVGKEAESKKTDESDKSKSRKGAEPRKPDESDKRKPGKGAESRPESSKGAESGLWRSHLSQSGSSQSTTSTSYLQPPSSGTVKKLGKKLKLPVEDMSRSLNGSGSSGKQMDPRLLTYIRKLLNMSRASIDDLTVSAASDVSTPSHSVVETPSNNPLLQLMNVMKYFNLDVADLQKQLSYTSDESSRHYNTSESVTVSSGTSDGERTVFKSCTEITSSGKIDESNKKLLHYVDIAASCTKKISNLTAMIEKVRAEKKKMLDSSPTSSDKDLTTTSYKELPDKSSTTNDLDELLNIDYSYAERLKRLSKEEIRTEKERAAEKEPTDDELLNRLQRLLQDKGGVNRKMASVSEKKMVQEKGGRPFGVISTKKVVEESKDGKTVGAVSEKVTVTAKPGDQKDPFPLFLDIPKLPRLEVSSLDKKKRPPPSKGLRAVAAVPHELSTIIEADSQTKIESPAKSRGSTDSSKSGDVPDILTEVPHEEIEEKKNNSSDDVSEMETMETMLLSIGMEWAIPTLKKTREALAMTSSSSGSKGSGEISLKEFLSKISSSSKSESSLNETQGISLIQMDNRKTSTPIGEKDEKKEGPVFLTDSDLSSVKEHSGKDSEDKFYDLLESSSKTR